MATSSSGMTAGTLPLHLPGGAPGCTASVETSDGVVHVRVHDAAGAPAAKGQMALLGRATVIDCVTTEEAHRRRGLGDFVMRTLVIR